MILFRHTAELQTPLVLKDIYFFVKVHFVLFVYLSVKDSKLIIRDITYASFESLIFLCND